MVISKKELARLVGVSLNTLDNWLAGWGDAVPVEQRGSNGRAYQFDQDKILAFIGERREEERAKKAERDEALAQLALPFLEPPTAPAQGVLSLKDQVAALQLRKLQREEAERLGRLVSADELRDALTTAFAALSRRIHAGIRQAGADANLPEPVIRQLDAKLATAQREFVREFQAFLVDPEHAAA
jgi:phage terminase Nu1 subunit (DNA packaging protein)